MIPNRRIPLMVTVTLIAIALIAAIGLPLFNVTTVAAGYANYAPAPAGPGCGDATYQIRLYGDTQTYADSALTQPSIVIDTHSLGRYWQKFLVCDSSLNMKSYEIIVPSTLVWIPKTAGQLVRRNYTDQQP